MIAVTDAIVDPWTMVIESFNAAVADGTVTRPWSSKSIALRAEIYWGQFFK